MIARAPSRPEVAPPLRWRGAASVLVAVAVLGAVLAVDPAGLRPFTTLRWPIVAACVLGAAALLWRSRPRLPRSVVVPGSVLLGCMTVAAIGSDDGLVPWLGHPQRHFGVLAWVVCAAGLVVGTALDGSARRVLGAASCLGAAALGIGALVEVAGVDIAGASFPGTRAGGTVGQPAYLGALGVLLVPVAVGVALEARDRAKAAAWVAAVLGSVAVVLSQTRGAWVGLLVAGVVACGLLRRRWPGTPLLGAAVLFVAAVAVAASPLGSRALSTFDLGGSAAQGRVAEWQVAARTVADHPLGVGPEGYRLEAPAHIDDEYGRRYGREVVVDRAHNGVLDVAVTGGVPAALAHLVLVGAVACRVWRRRAELDPLVAGAAAAAAGYVAQQLVLFPVAEIDPLAWMVTGVALAATLERAPRERRTGGGALVVPALLAVLAVGTLVIGALDVVADRRLGAAERALGAGRSIDALTAADAATALRPDSIDGWYVAARAAAAGPSLVDVDVALDRVGSGLARSPRDPALLDLEERLLVERALRSGLATDRAEAVAAVRDRIEHDPANPAHHDLLDVLTEPERTTG